MKSLLCVLALGLLTLASLAQNFPKQPNPPRLVNDFAGVLGPSEQEALENKLRGYNDTTSTQLAIVTIDSYNGYDPAEYTFELANEWGIGQKGKNNGLLITVAVQDRKYFIATGYGLEGSIPDAITRRVGDQYFKPNFRAGNYYQGLDEAVTYLASLPADEFKADRRSQDGGDGDSWGLLIAAIIVLIIISAIFRGGRGNRRGGYRGGGMFFPPFITLGSGGSSGGWGGGGGGSFGGFGGGSFGGGGSGGSW